MGIESSAPTSRRGYLSPTELEQFANITIIDPAEAADRISQAEEIIDSYAGFQQKFLNCNIEGRAVSGGASQITLATVHQNAYEIDYLLGCEVEIIGGTGSGQRRRVTSSTYAGVLTVADAWTTVPDSTSFYRIYQLGKFPRYKDVTYWTENQPYQYFKAIPEAVKRAVAAQVEYIINMGDEFFSTNQSDKTMERIGDYAYTVGGQGTSPSPGAGANNLIAPKAKLLLRGIKSRIGQIAY